jgi:MOSC domain-containing protein YiiM
VKTGRVEALFIGLEIGGVMRAVESVRAVPGRGVEGDRHWQTEAIPERKRGPDREITLIESEAIEALRRDEKVAFDPSESRRNVVTRGVALNHLVGRTFRVGDVRLRGIRLCEPCKHLEAMTRPGVMMGLLHRGGLRAQVLDEGGLRVGDPVEIVDEGEG